MENFSSWQGEKKFYGSIKKRYCGNLSQLPENSKNFIQMLNGPEFLKFLEDITSIKHLIPDPYLEGGGFHSIGVGGFLKIHADFNWHAKLKLHRRINVLFYLNSEWKSEWGGDLELWDSNMKCCIKRIEPIINRMVIFNTTDNSFHGHPDPLKCPENIERKSIALYYYTVERPESEIVRGYSSNTDYRERPNEKFKYGLMN